MSSLWQHILEIGARHGVSPPVFAVLYLAHHPLFWGTMAWLAARVRAKQTVGGVAALGVFFWFLPYTYLVVFGRGIPWWAYALGAGAIALGAAHAVREVRRRVGR